MPTDPSQEILDYFNWKAQNVPLGVPPAEMGEVQTGSTPTLSGLPDLSEQLYSDQKSTIFDYINQEYIDQKGLKETASLNVDELNKKFTTDLSQGVLDKLLDKFIKDSGGNDSAIYSSLSYSGFMSADLKDYLKITLRKPSSKDDRSLERRLNSLDSSSEFIDNVLQDYDLETNLEDGVSLADEIKQNFNQIKNKIGTNVGDWSEGITNFFTETLLGNIESQITEETIREIYGDDGVVEIYLPLPKEISEVYAHQIEQTSLSGFAQLQATAEFGMAALKLGGRVAAAGAQLMGETESKIGRIIANTTIPGVENALSGLQGSLDFISATSRKAYNPVQEMLYKTPEPRRFIWNIEIMPTSQEQARSTAMIIQALKEHSLPINIGDVLYDFPGFVEFEFYINNKLANFLPRSLYFDAESKSKVPSFIKSLQVQYSSNNMYSHFVDNYPTNYVLMLELVETQPLDRNIIMGDAGNNSIVKHIDGVNSFFNDQTNRYIVP